VAKLWKAVVCYLCLQRALAIAEQSQSEIHIKNVVYHGTQISPQLPGLYRDGSASVLLNGRVIWQFDDIGSPPRTPSFSLLCPTLLRTAMLLSEISHCCSIFGIFASGKQNTAQEQAVAAVQTLSDGGWIPFAKDELAFNRKDPGQQHIAICGTLAAHIRLRSEYNSEHRARHEPTPLNSVRTFGLCDSRKQDGFEGAQGTWCHFGYV
jgi:hypothetical protein